MIVVGTIGYALTCAVFAFLPWTSPLLEMALFPSLGFLLMIGCAVLVVVGALRVRETHCRNQTIRG